MTLIITLVMIFTVILTMRLEMVRTGEGWRSIAGMAEQGLVYLVVLQVDTDEIQGNTWDSGALSSSTYRKSGMDRRCSYAELRF